MENIDSKVRIAFVLMWLGVAIPIVAIATLYLLTHRVAVYVYIFSGITSAGWMGLFFLCLRNLKYGMLAGAVWGLVNAIGASWTVARGQTPLSEALGLPICPLAIASALIGLVMVYLGYSSYKDLRKI
jgi:hypothetical protein